jgi:hypothetical protein
MSYTENMKGRDRFGRFIKGYSHSKKTRDKMSISHTGVELSFTHKENIGKSVQGENNGMYGKPLSKEHKDKIRKSLTGYKHTEEACANMKLAQNKLYNTGKITWNKGLKKEIDKRVKKNGLGISKSLKGKYVGEKNHMYGKKLPDSWRINMSLALGGTGDVDNFNKDYPRKFNARLKNKIRERDNYRCQNCGMTQEEHYIVYGRDIEVHHIDYDRENCKEDNLITTCKQCNIRANKNKTYWKDYYKQKIKAKETENVIYE